MNKKFLSVILFSALMVGTAGTFTSCKDYDDDIKDLQGQLDKKASLDDLNAKVATLQTAVDEAKTAANEAKAKAQEALDKAGSSEGGVSEADLEKLQDAWKKKWKSWHLQRFVDTKIKELKESLASEFISEADLKKLATDVETLSVKVMALIGHRLTSLTLIPTTHINGIPSIELLTLTYSPQVFAAKNYADHEADPSKHTDRPVLDHTAVKGAKALSISTERMR